MGSTTLSSKPPFGVIFEYFNSSDAIPAIKTSPLKNYTSVKCQTFLMRGSKSCNVWYRDAIKVRPEILKIIEHNQPVSLKTLALQVQYFSPESAGEKNSVDKVVDKMNKVLVKTDYQIHLNEIKPSDKVSIDLPKKSLKVSSKEINNIIYPPGESSESSGGDHHHDIFD